MNNKNHHFGGFFIEKKEFVFLWMVCYNKAMSEIEIKHHVELINKSEEKELFEKNKNYILEVVNCFLSSFDFSANLTIYVDDSFVKKEFVNGEITEAYSSVTKYGHVIVLSNLVLQSVEHDGGLLLCSSIVHELGHVYDHHHILKSPYCKFNPMKLSHKTVADLVFACGYHFWAEVYAYDRTFYAFKELREKYPTFLKIVKAYKNLKERHAEIYKYIWTDEKRVSRKNIKFKEDVDAFVYALSKHIAGTINKAKYYKYSDKTKNMKEFKEVETIIQRIYAKVVPIFTNTYGRGMTNKIGWLGNSIIVNIYKRFNICPVQGKKEAYFAMCLKEKKWKQ